MFFWCRKRGEGLSVYAARTDKGLWKHSKTEKTALFLLRAIILVILAMVLRGPHVSNALKN